MQLFLNYPSCKRSRSIKYQMSVLTATGNLTSYLGREAIRVYVLSKTFLGKTDVTTAGTPENICFRKINSLLRRQEVHKQGLGHQNVGESTLQFFDYMF